MTAEDEDDADITGRVEAIVDPISASLRESGSKARHASGVLAKIVREIDARGRRHQRILVVDDNVEHLVAMHVSLDRAGFDVDTAADAASAMVALRTKAYDAAIVDFVLPGATGGELVQQLRQRSVRRRMPVIMISGLDEERLSALAAEFGADDWLAKTFDAAQLVAKLDEWIPVLIGERKS